MQADTQLFFVTKSPTAIFFGRKFQMQLEKKQSPSRPKRSDIKVQRNQQLAQLLSDIKERLANKEEPNLDRTDLKFKLRKALIEPDEYDPNGYERILGISDLRSINYLSRGIELAKTVCRIKVTGAFGDWFGTGFLVGHGLLVTNNHVIPSKRDAGRAMAEFDHENDLDGAVKAPIRFKITESDLFYTNPDLDVTFVSLAELSEERVPIKRFGRLPLLPLSGKAVHGEWVTIIQHPGGQTKQIAINSSQVIELKRGTKFEGFNVEDFVHYTTDTEPGSSGAPVFNDQWQVVAIHHKAVPKPGFKVDFDLRGTDRYAEIPWIANEGIRISAIFRQLQNERLGNPDAAIVLARLEHSIGMSPGVPALGVNRITNTKPDDVPFEAEHWANAELAPKLGYMADFLSTELPLARIVGRRNAAKAARLVGADNFILDYLHFSSVIHKDRRFPLMTAVNIHGALLRNPGERSNGWRRDKRMADDFQADEAFYRYREGSDPVHFSRGHLVRRLDPCWGTEEEAKTAELHTFHYTNAAPQVQHYNDVDWGNLEDYLLNRAQTAEQKMTVFTGPVFRSSDPQFRRNGDKTTSWQIPVSYWKVAVLQKFPDDIAVAAFVIGQLDYLRPLYEKQVFSRLSPYSDAEIQSPTIQTTVEVVEALTGLNFTALRGADRFAGLPELTSRDIRFITSGSDIVI